MKKTLKKSKLLLALIILFVGNILNAQVTHLVISQVYGAGGNAGASYKNDYVEIFNPTGSSVGLTGWSIQYASAAGTTWAATTLTGSIAPGKYYLVQLAGGAVGAILPTADLIGTTNMSGTAGKIVLVSNTTLLVGSCPTGGAIVDFVGFGATANCFEGAGPTPAPSSTNSVFRASNGCTDTDANSTNFTAAAANPRNSGTLSNVCSSGGPTQLVITSINPVSPSAGVGFSVTVQSQDGSNAPQNVLANTAFSLTTNGNAGAIGGTVVGTIFAGSSSAVVSGVTLPNIGTGVTITASVTSGDNLSNGTSSTFSVVGVATQLTFVGVPSSGYVASSLATFSVEARRADNSIDNNFNGSITVSKASGPGSLSGTTSVAAVAGVATFSTLQFDQIGTYSLSTASGTLTPNTSSSIVISPSPVTWNFTAPTAANVPANLTVSTMTIGNTYGPTPPAMISPSSASNSYTGASGGNNAGVPTATGTAVNTATNAYFEFSLTPDPNYVVTLNGLSFGTRSTGTGPQAFYIRSNKDNYAADIASGTIANSSVWALKTPAVSSTSSNAGNIITFRIYGYNGSGNATQNQINWRIDDVLLNLNVIACTQPVINVNSGSICTGNTFTINPSGGVSYSVTGNSFTVNPTVTSSYTVTGADAIGCSNTASLTLTVNNCSGTTSLTPTSCGSTVTSLDNFLYYHAVAGATNYKVEIVSAQQSYSVVNVRNRTVPDFKLSWIPGTQYGRTYTIRVAAYVSGSWRPFGPACTVTTASIIPTTQLSAGSCGATLSVLDETVNFNQVAGATNYRVEITNPSQPLNTVSVRNSTVLNFKMSFFSGVQYNQTYDIRIGAYVNGAWQPYGVTCQVTTPASAPTSSLVAAVCGATVSSLGQIVNFTTVSGATNYRVLVTNATQSLSAVNTRNNTQATFALAYVPNTIAGRTYNVSVAALIGGVWGSYGPICQLTATSSAREESSRIINAEANSIEESIEFNMYPNPNNGLFNIELNEVSQVIISNTLGQVVLNETMEIGINNLNIESQPTGIYFVKVIQNGKQQTSKIIKE